MQFDQARHDQAKTRFLASTKAGVETVPMWKGDHKACKHHTGECNATNGWLLDREARPRPIIINMNVEPNAAVEIEDKKDRLEPRKPLWKVKGFVPAEESEGVRPSQGVLLFLLEAGERDVERLLEHKQADYATVQAEKAKFRAAFEKANFSKSEKTTRG